MSLIVALIIGGIVGWLAGIMMGTSAQFGRLTTVIVGAAGGYMGIFLADALKIQLGGPLEALASSILGAMLLIATLRALGAFDRFVVAR
jgi:uncharacterized membrane protein YeaQ/YmgE (transglycosylase-associated protein family)